MSMITRSKDHLLEYVVIMARSLLDKVLEESKSHDQILRNSNFLSAFAVVGKLWWY